MFNLIHKNTKILTNQRFGRLIVVYLTNKRTKDGCVIWLCRCDCGNLTKARSSSLLAGNIQSCGCLQKEKARKNLGAPLKHGDARKGKHTKLYSIWVNIKQRCFNQSSNTYKYYGGQGISVCDKWKNSYWTFKIWAMSHGYEEGLTIDRINHKGNYEPSNCQWITRINNVKKSHRERKEKEDSK